MTETQAYNPKVSVVMSIYKEPLQWITLALDSILDQSFRDFEVILICDNPDYSESIDYIQTRAKQDNRIRLIVNGTNIGLTRSLNKGIGLAKGEYIARMDADDISFRERFEKQVRFLDSHRDISVCASDVHIINDEGNVIRYNKYKRKYNNNWYFITNVFAHPTVMFRKELTSLRTPLYNEDFTYSQDYELWQFLIIKGCRLHIMEESLLLYRKSRKQISSVHHRQQVHFFKLAHRSLTTDYLISKGIINANDSGNLETMLAKATEAYKRFEGTERDRLTLIIYNIYFGLGTYSWKYRFKYIMDKNLIAFRTRFILTYRLFTSSKTRRDRTGLI